MHALSICYFKDPFNDLESLSYINDWLTNNRISVTVTKHANLKDLSSIPSIIRHRN